MPKRTRRLLYPVAAYALAIGCMGAFSLARRGTDETVRGRLAVYGAALFMVSDTLLALDRFVTPIPGGKQLVMLSYYGAQAGIAFSASARPQEPAAAKRE